MEEQQYIKLEDLETLFSKYFLTLEEKENIEKELKELKEQEQILELEEEKLISLTDEEFRKEVITEIKKNNEYVQYSNNSFYLFMVLGSTILICTLLYKTLKKFF